MTRTSEPALSPSLGPFAPDVHGDCYVGVQVSELACTASVPGDMAQLVGAADVIIVSGGNTVFAVDRWFKIGLDALLRQAKDRGAVLGGGSAGAICWYYFCVCRS